MVGAHQGARDGFREREEPRLTALWLIAMALVATGVFGDVGNLIDHPTALRIAVAGGALGALWSALELRRVIERRR